MMSKCMKAKTYEGGCTMSNTINHVKYKQESKERGEMGKHPRRLENLTKNIHEGSCGNVQTDN